MRSIRPLRSRTGTAGLALLTLVSAACGAEAAGVSAAAPGEYATPSTIADTATPSTIDTPRSDVLLWANGHMTYLSAVQSDMQTLSSEASSLDVDGLGYACRDLQDSLDDALGDLPSPDFELTSNLQNAYEAYRDAATDCVIGTSTMDPVALTTAVSGLSRGNPYIEAATERINELG